MDRNLKKALKCILRSCGLEAVHKINDDYIEFDKTKLCKNQWVKDIDLPEEDDEYVRMFVHLYRDTIDICTEYDDDVLPDISTITLQLAFLCDVEKLVVNRHASLLIEAAGNRVSESDNTNQSDELIVPPFQMPDVPLMDNDSDCGEIPESRSTTISTGDNLDCSGVPESRYTPISVDGNLDCGEIPEPRLFTPLRISDDTEIN